MPHTATVMASNTSASLDSVRIQARHPSEFFADVVNSFRSIDNCFVLPEDAQRGLLYILKSCGLLREELHLNPANSFDYRSSSYNSRQGAFVVAAGGNGPPQSVNGSFCHSHTDDNFSTVHPNVDLSAYESKPQKTAQSIHSRKQSSKKPKPEPVQKPAHRTLASNGQDLAPALPAFKVTDTDAPETNELVEGPSAPITPTEQEVRVKIEMEEPEQSAATAVDAGPDGKQRTDLTQPFVDNTTFSEDAAAELNIASLYNDVIDDTGIAIDDVFASETQLTENAPATRESTDSSSRDSTYGTQSQLHFGDDARFNVQHTLAGSNHSDVNGDVIEDEQSQSPKQSRKKPVPKLIHATRRSSRLSAINTDTTSEPASSLGKHSREDFEDTASQVADVDEPDVKRTKASQD